VADIAPEVYSDSSQFIITPYGAALKFSLTEAKAMPPNEPIPENVVVIVRMSAEHMKAFAFQLVRGFKQFEANQRTVVNVAPQALNNMSIGPEDWSAFWKQ
jgi:hypothetical protein